MTTPREQLCRGLTCAAWGYFFLYFDFNLNSVSLLPDFVAFVLFLRAIGLMEEEERDLALLRPLALALLVWEGADWLLSWAGEDLASLFAALNAGWLFYQPLYLTVQAMSLYFHFQLFTDLAAMAARWQAEGQGLDRRLLRLRTALTLLITATAVLTRLLPPGRGWSYGVLTALLVVSLVVAVLLMLGAFALRRAVRDRPLEEAPPDRPS